MKKHLFPLLWKAGAYCFFLEPLETIMHNRIMNRHSFHIEQFPIIHPKPMREFFLKGEKQSDCPITKKTKPSAKEKDYSHRSSLVAGFVLVLATLGLTVFSNYL